MGYSNCIQCDTEFKVRKGRNGKPTTHCSNSCAALSRHRRPNDLGRWQCRVCKEWLDEDQFSKNKNSKNGLDSTCRYCKGDSHRQWRETTPNYNRFSIGSRYGIGKARLDEMYEEQESRCYACGDWYEVLHLDHDHSCCPTGGSCGECVRALLCKYCNSVLGYVNDDIDRLNNLIDYLGKFKK